MLRRAHEGIVAAMSRPLTAKTPEGRFRELITAMLKSALDPSRPKWQTRVLGRELFQPTPVLDLMDDLVRPTAHRLSQTMGEIRPDLSFQRRHHCQRRSPAREKCCSPSTAETRALLR